MSFEMEMFEIVKTNETAVAPYVVETRATENWSSHSQWKAFEHADFAAEMLRSEYPNLPIRIKHRTGGLPFQGEQT